MELTDVLPPARVHTRLIDRLAYAHDASYFRLIPQAVVQPASISEIQGLFRYSQQRRLPLTFRAAGTSLSGQAVTDGLLVDLSKHWQQYRVEADGRRVRAQPGVVGGFLNQVLRPFGRRLGPDPASLDACLLGGILANNSSGMCCGVTENAYQTLHALTIVLPNGYVVDTADPAAPRRFADEQAPLAAGLLELRRRLLSQPALAGRVARRYQMKNTIGYALNALLDFAAPLDILAHLMIGSEGTLGFIAEAVLETLPDYAFKYTGQLYFPDIQAAAAAIHAIKKSGARAAEVMDREALRAVEALPGVPAILRQLPAGATALLVEYQAEDRECQQHFQKEAARVVRGLTLLHDAEFTDDPAAQATLWKARKGILASIGARRPRGTTSLIEDVAFPVERLAEAVTDLRRLFDDHGYSEAVIFGHAKDGNLHFLVNQAFDTDEHVRRFDRFLQGMVAIVSGKYDGALKAEHGTGRNMAPFVETEWGAEAYALMRDLKALLDPDGLLNPGVIINADPQAHVTHLKALPAVAPEIDQCTECGYCEAKCPARHLTITPRQRIVIQREIAQLKAAGASAAEIAPLTSDFRYAGIETCAADGLCATACPVGINTGVYIKHLRAEAAAGAGAALWLADHFALTEQALGWGVRLGHAAERVIGVSGVRALSVAAERVTGAALPKWNGHIPAPAKLPAHTGAGRPEASRFVYFPACVSRQLGQPAGRGQPRASLADTFLALARRAGLDLAIPADAAGQCCGMPFASKGYRAAYQATVQRTLQKLWAWSEAGRYSIVIDTTSCAYTLRLWEADLSPEDRALWEKLTLLDGIEFLHDHVLPRLDLQPLDEAVVLHPNCAARKLGLEAKLVAIAQRCARSVTVPLQLGCCAFAGDRGLLYPELTAAATAAEAAEVKTRAYAGYYSSNITCEIGLSEATGRDYVGIVYLVEKAAAGSDRQGVRADHALAA